MFKKEVDVRFKLVQQAKLADVVQVVDFAWCDGCTASGKNSNYSGLQLDVGFISNVSKTTDAQT